MTTITKSISSTGNRKIFTVSVWVKRANGISGGNGSIFCVGTANSDSGKFRFVIDSSHRIRIEGGATAFRVSEAVLTDQFGWYHLVCAVDTTQASASNRIKAYINGEQITTWTTNNTISQDQNTPVNESGKTHYINSEADGVSGTFKGYFAHFHLVDGTAYTPTTFGETDSTTGIWKPKADPSGISYGTNGVFLKFENSGNMGLDSSGQTNNYTIGSAGTLPQTTDTPSNNFAVLNPYNRRNTNSSPTYSHGNLFLDNQDQDGQSNNWCSTIGGLTKGKWYCEITPHVNGSATTGMKIGVVATSSDARNGSFQAGDRTGVQYYYVADGNKRYSSETTSGATTESYGATYTTDDIIGIFLDLDNGTVKFSKNGVIQNSGTAAFTDLLTNMNYSGYMFGGGVGTAGQYAQNQIKGANFGNPRLSISSSQADANGYGNFEYTPNDGSYNYYALCTKNLQEFN
tara:strand:+ start:251 stop:1627 length:1377 start_codon:yes stop_codon:yes gene_type:complete